MSAAMSTIRAFAGDQNDPINVSNQDNNQMHSTHVLRAFARAYTRDSRRVSQATAGVLNGPFRQDASQFRYL